MKVIGLLGQKKGVKAIKGPRVGFTAWPESSPFNGIIRVRFKGSSVISRTSQPAGSPAYVDKNRAAPRRVNEAIRGI